MKTVVIYRDSSRDVWEALEVLRNRSAMCDICVLDEDEVAPPGALVFVDLPEGVRHPSRHLRVNTNDLRQHAPANARSDDTTFLVGVKRNPQKSETFTVAVLAVADRVGISYCLRNSDLERVDSPERRYTTLSRRDYHGLHHSIE